MKLCWDNLENIRLNKNGNFKDILKNKIFYIMKCKECKEEYLGRYDSIYCDVGCSNKNNKTGTYKSEESKQKIRDLWKNPKSKYNSKSYRKSLASHGSKNGNWNGGYTKNGICRFDVYAPHIKWCEEVRRNKQDPNILEVRCFKCDKWFVPRIYQINNRITSITDKEYNRGEHHFYCSDECKNSCSIYGKKPETIIRGDAIRVGKLKWLELKREAQPELRQMVLDRDNHQCVKCGSKSNLQCHHIQPTAVEPIESADVDNCITLCYDCHRKVHMKDGCRYGQLRIEEC